MALQSQPVRFGGIQTPDAYVFELTGGHLCLDLANTLDERKTDHPRELLRTWEDLLDWGLQAGAIPVADARVLRRYAHRHAHAARSALTGARVLREAIFETFDAVVGRRSVPSSALALVNRAMSRAAERRRLEPRSGGFSWGWRGGAADLERVVWPVAWSAGELLTSANLDRVRMCAGAGCAWLFIDSSRNGTRRWCDMSVCGNRAKARRHYAKVREQ